MKDYRVRGVIFDRDDTLTADVGFTYKLDDLRLLPGVEETLAFLSKNRIPIGIATNQSGIGEGRYNFYEMYLFNKALSTLILNITGYPPDFAICSHRIASPPICGCRKPQPTLLLRICKLWGFAPTECLFIGDSATDEQAAKILNMPFYKCSPSLDRNTFFTEIKARILYDQSPN